MLFFSKQWQMYIKYENFAGIQWLTLAFNLKFYFKECQNSKHFQVQLCSYVYVKYLKKTSQSSIFLHWYLFWLFRLVFTSYITAVSAENDPSWQQNITKGIKFITQNLWGFDKIKIS